DVIEKNPPDVAQRRTRTVDINIFLRLPVGGAHANDIPFVRDYADQLVLTKKAGEGRIGFTFFLARLDGHGEIVFAVEAEAHHNMRDRFAGAVDGDDVG